MKLFDFFKRRSKNDEITAPNPPQPPPELQPAQPQQEAIHPSEYEAFRQAEIEKLERLYDLTTANGINSIPLSAGKIQPGEGFHSYTGDIDYYLRAKGFRYEEEGNIPLAILCLKKSNEIRFACRKGYHRDDYYSYVRLLARSGYVEAARAEKARIDSFFDQLDFDNDSIECEPKNVISRLINSANYWNTDLVWLAPHGCSCPECAKYQGRVFSLYGKDGRFPRIPAAFWSYGAIHKGCGHCFHVYLEGTSNYELEQALEIQKISNPRYRKSIIAFSNRPFVDDRPAEDIATAIQYIEKRRAEEEHKWHLWETMIEAEAKRGEEKRIYQWIHDNLPDLCPKSYSGYRRMKTQNTKNYQKIQCAAKELGKII